MRRLLGVLMLAAALLAGCTSQSASQGPSAVAATPLPSAPALTPAPAASTVAATPIPIASPTAEPTPTLEPTPAPTLEPVGTQADPVPRGTTVRVGDWDVTVSAAVNFNAWSVVKAANMFNTKPPAGWVDVLIPLKAVYRGTDRGDLALIGNTTAVLGTATLTERQSFTDPTCGVIPKSLGFGSPTVRPGGKLTGNICIVVEKSDVPTLVLLWAPDLFGMDNATYFALR